MALRTPLTAQPHLYIGDSTGRPLDYGRVYFGEPNKDPEFYPIDIYLDPEMTIAAAQPVRTKGGFMDVGGNLAELHATEVVYSLKVLDQYGRQVFYKPEMYRNNVSDFLVDEITRATAAETLIAGNLTAETQRAIAAEKVIATAVVTEEDRAIAAEGLLDDKYEGLSTTIGSIGGGKKAYTTYAKMVAAAALPEGDPLKLPANSSVDVTNDSDANKNATYAYDGTTFTKSAYDLETLVRNKVINSFSTLAKMQTDGTSLADGTLAQVYNETTNNGLYVKTAGAWVKAAYDPVSAAVTQSLNNLDAALSIVTKTDYFGSEYSEAEKQGTVLYTTYYVGVNGTTKSKEVVFNALDIRLINPSNKAVEYRVFTGSTVVASGAGNIVFSANQNSPTVSGFCKSVPSSDTGKSQIVTLDKLVRIKPNTPFVIMFRSATGEKISLGYHKAVSGNLESRGFNYGIVDSDWGVSQIYAGGVPAYTQAGFNLLLDSGSYREVIAPINNHQPEIVMPKKIYTTGGLQAHIYPEHLLLESDDLYMHDVDCLKGSQVERGWVFNPSVGEAYSENPLTWGLYDKQTATQLDTVTTSVVVASPTKSGTKNVLVVGDSLVSAGVITQRLLDISSTNTLKVNLLGTKGTAPNSHEGRGGWVVASYTSAGVDNYRFTVSGVTTTPALNSAIYSFNGGEFKVQDTAIVEGSGSITCSYTGTAPTVGAAGTLIKVNGSAGDTTIAFSNVQLLTSNPFWFDGSLDFSRYININGYATPDVVLFNLGINDSFGASSDAGAKALTVDAFNRYDNLIASIKIQNPAVKIGLIAPPSYANQDAFGANYGTGQTAWRAKRNIVIWNRELYARYKDAEAQNVFIVAAGLNVDTKANYSTTTQATNSHNTTPNTTQSNGVHPADSGYKQMGDSIFAFIKAVS